MTGLVNDEQRFIALEGTWNTREVGGYETHDGKITKHNQLLRSDGLHALSRADIEKLKGIGLKTVVDLRRDDEREREPNVLADESWVDYRPVPIYQKEPHARGWKTDTIFPYYCALIDSSQDTIKQVLALMAEPDNFPLMLHCSAGKDRTGLLVALALEMAGVPRETIAADYAPSSDNIEALKPKFRAAFERNTDLTPEVYERLLLSPPEAILGLFDFIEEHYESVPAYARKIGLRDEEMALIRKNLLAME